VVHLSHRGEQPQVLDEDAAKEFHYSNDFECMDVKVPFRAPRVTPRPNVRGLQTATVVGPASEEVHVDEHGRVKVKFHWDREATTDETSSCWVRVSQMWAGNNFGAMFLPRIGHEVIVDFIEGDPDRPLITGRIYTGFNKPPYALPDEKTKSTIKSDSSPGGGGSNELRFEDAKGSEELYLHAQRDLAIAVEHDKLQTVGNDESLTVGHDRTKLVKNDETEEIKHDRTIKVGNAHSEHIGADMQLTVGANLSATVGGGKSVSVKENSTESAGKNLVLQAGKHITLDATQNINLSSGGSTKVVIGDKLTIACGAATITVQSSGAVTIQTAGAVTVKGSSIKLN
jgi:type VI secretion system secreted protein VgrG